MLWKINKALSVQSMSTLEENWWLNWIELVLLTYWTFLANSIFHTLVIVKSFIRNTCIASNTMSKIISASLPTYPTIKTMKLVFGGIIIKVATLYAWIFTESCRTCYAFWVFHLYYYNQSLAKILFEWPHTCHTILSRPFSYRSHVDDSYLCLYRCGMFCTSKTPYNQCTLSCTPISDVNSQFESKASWFPQYFGFSCPSSIELFV